MPEFLVEILFSPIESFLVYVDSGSPGSQEVLHLPHAPSHHVLQPAADGGRGPAHAGVAVHIDRVPVLQQPVQQAHSLGQHLGSS